MCESTCRLQIDQCSIRLLVRSLALQAGEVGSIPTRSAKYGELAERLTRFAHNEEYTGSNPVLTTKQLTSEAANCYNGKVSRLLKVGGLNHPAKDAIVRNQQAALLGVCLAHPADLSK